MNAATLSPPGHPSLRPANQHSHGRAEYSVRLLQNIASLRSAHAKWDDLWQRSNVAAPSMRAELIAGWLEQFAPQARTCAVVIEHGQKFVAALPLVGLRTAGFLELASTPANGWGVSGDLLLDETYEPDVVLDYLVEGLVATGWPALWLEQIPFEQPRWQVFRQALERAGVPTCVREHYRIGQVEILSSWAAYERTLEGDHRRSRQRYTRMMEKAGPTELRVQTEFDPAEVAQHIRRGFEIEDRSWKAASGTSVLRSPGLLQYYVHQAEQLARWGQLELVWLEHCGGPVAFDFGWKSKSTHFVCKLGYDDAFRKFGPGQQMIQRLLHKMHDEQSHQVLDFWGPLVPWNASWSSRSYAVGRLVAPLSSVVGRSVFHAYKNWQPKLRRLQSRLQRTSSR